MFPRPALGLNALRYAPPAAFTVQHPYLRHDVTKSPKVRTVLSLTRHISDSSAMVRYVQPSWLRKAEAPGIIVLTRVLFALVFSLGSSDSQLGTENITGRGLQALKVGYLGPPYSSEQGLVFFGLIVSEEPRSRSAVQGQYCNREHAHP